MLAPLPLPHTLDTRIGPARLRRATPEDAAAIIALLADDAVSASRGDTAADADLPRYQAAMHDVLADASNDLLVVETGGEVVGTLQLTSIPGMARRGARRLLVEAVRIRGDLRSSGIGGAAMGWVEEIAAPALGAAMIQLTSDAARVDAHRFYERLGYVASHVGFKRHLRH